MTTPLGQVFDHLLRAELSEARRQLDGLLPLQGNTSAVEWWRLQALVHERRQQGSAAGKAYFTGLELALRLPEAQPQQANLRYSYGASQANRGLNV